MFTKLRSFPSWLYRCAFKPECFVVRSTSSSPTVLPSASTASFLSVNGRSGVGIRILVAIELALVKCGTVFLQIPDGHGSRLRPSGAMAGRSITGHGHDDVRKRRPRVIEIVLRRPRRMVRMRMIETQQVAAELARFLLGHAVIRWADHETAARSFFSGVWQRDRRCHAAALSNERAATLVRVRFFAVPADLRVDLRVN